MTISDDVLSFVRIHPGCTFVQIVADLSLYEIIDVSKAAHALMDDGKVRVSSQMEDGVYRTRYWVVG